MSEKEYKKRKAMESNDKGFLNELFFCRFEIYIGRKKIKGHPLF